MASSEARVPPVVNRLINSDRTHERTQEVPEVASANRDGFFDEEDGTDATR